MVTNRVSCSEKVHGTGLFSYHCSRKAIVERNGLWYCNAAFCQYKSIYYDAVCGKLAVTTDFGDGRCADHTREAIATKGRLEKAAPSLLHALQRIVYILETRDGDIVSAMTQAKDAIALTDKPKEADDDD